MTRLRVARAAPPTTPNACDEIHWMNVPLALASLRSDLDVPDTQHGERWMTSLPAPL
jgi:hypothetical protein